MSLADLVRKLATAGATPEVIALAVEAVEAEQAKDASRRAKRAEQKRRERDKVATVARQSGDNGATVANLVSPSPEKETSPTPPKEKLTLTPSTTQRAQARGSRLPVDWRPNDAGRSLAVSLLGSNASAHAELARFTDHWLAKAGPDAVKRDWDATWRNWIRRAAEQQPRGPPRPTTRNGKPSIQDFAKADYDRLHKPDLPDFGDSPGGLRSLPRG